MEYKRSHALSKRYKRRLSFRSSALSLLLLLTVCGVIVFALTTSQAAGWLSENVFDPMLRRGSPDSTAKTVSAMKSDTTSAPAITPFTPAPASVTVTLEKATFYMLQMGCFDTQDQASEAAHDWIQMGAAGYVFFDGALYRVIAASYGSSAELINVQNRVRVDGYANSAYILNTNTLRIEASGEGEVVQNLQNAVEWLQTLPKLLTDYAVNADRDGITESQAREQVAEWIEINTKFRHSMEQENKNDSVRLIVSALIDYDEYLSTFLNYNATIDAAELSSRIKTLQIRTIIRYYEMTGKGIKTY